MPGTNQRARRVRHARRSQAQQERSRAAAQKRFTEPLTPKRAARIANAQSGTEYHPVIRSIAAEARASKKREGDLGQWYDQEAATQAAAIPVAQAGTAATITATNDRLAAAGAADAANLAALSDKDAAFAKLVGGPTNASGLAQAAAGAGARAQQAIALNAPTAAMGASYANELGAKVVATRQRGVEARGAESSRRRKIVEDLQAAKKQRGQATVKTMSDLREGEREAQTTRQAFGLDKVKAAVDARQGAASIAVSRKNAQTSARNASTSERSASTSERSAAETARHNRKTETGTGLTPTQRHDIKVGRKNAMATAISKFKARTWPNWAALERAVARESEVSPADAAWAVARLRRHEEQPPWWEK